VGGARTDRLGHFFLEEWERPPSDTASLPWSFLYNLMGHEVADHGELTDRSSFGEVCAGWREKLGLSLYPDIFHFDAGVGFLVKLMQAKWSLFHLVPLNAGQLPHRRSFIAQQPSARILKQWLSGVPEPAAAIPKYAEAVVSKFHGLPAARILQFLDATRYIKSIRQMPEAIDVFTKLILKDHAPPDVMHRDHTNYGTMRRARVHLDATACLLFRRFYESLSWELVWLHVYTDASPQWRGKELFASSFDLFSYATSTVFYQRRLFPHIGLGFNMYSAIGKCFSLLWQIFLVAGPTYLGMRSFCNRIGSFITDFGTEHVLPNFRDILIPFMQYIGGRVPKYAIAQTFMFPNALLTPGWFHLWDGVIRFGLMWTPPPTFPNQVVCLFVCYVCFSVHISCVKLCFGYTKSEERNQIVYIFQN
jgi:hypothetical protein